MFDDFESLLLVICFAYGLGSIPFGLIFTKLAGAGDIRQVGSGNIGATNVLRTGNKKLAIATLVFDAGKGATAVLLATLLTSSVLTALAAVLVVLGHCFPVWLKFKGGKGVATSLAALAALDVYIGGLFVSVWLFTAFVSRYSSLSALLSMLACVLAGFIVLDDIMTQVAILLLGALVWSRHHENIGRLLTGKETKIGNKSI
ncbi:glycerol-3-phosphate 1-O-acyltransferase PlsY [Candidatus Puniceispirillum sp.]|nr:glycerol-3-phosphate 1-O-acyltransferase PlsY [Candidatus Puniceispirillum sp.]